MQVHTATAIQHGLHATGAKPVSLQTIVSQAMGKADGDIAAAVDLAWDAIQNNKRLTEDAARMGLRNLIGESVRSERRGFEMAHSEASAAPFIKAPHRMNAAAIAAQERIRGMGATAARALLNAPYTINGVYKPLRDWHGTEILAHGETELAKGMTSVRNARFLISVGHAAGTALIGAKLKDADVSRLRALADSIPA